MKQLIALTLLVLLSACSPLPTATLAPTVDIGAIQTQAALSVRATETASVPTATQTAIGTPTSVRSVTPSSTTVPTQTETRPATTTPWPTDTVAPTATFTRVITRAPIATSTPNPPIPFGQDVTLGSWTFHVVSTYKDKNVWFYDETKVANGLWAVVVIKAVNNGSGTDWIGNSIDFAVYDQSLNIIERDPLRGAAEEFARWEFCGCSTVYSDVNPGENPGIAMVFDVPANTQNLTLMAILDAHPSTGYRLGLGIPFAELPTGRPKK